MTMPGFTAAAASGEPVGRYITLTSFGVSAPGVRPQLDEKDYAADDPTDPSLVPLGDVGTGSLLGGGTTIESFFSSFKDAWLDGLGAGLGASGGVAKAACEAECRAQWRANLRACESNDDYVRCTKRNDLDKAICMNGCPD